MNREIKLQPFSALFGLAIGVLAFVCMSQIMAPTIPTHRVECGPHPRDMVQIREGTPYVVPSGRILVVTAIGTTDGVPCNQYRPTLLVNGSEELVAFSFTLGENSVRGVASGLTLPAGFTVDVSTNCNQHGRAWGYLADK